MNLKQITKASKVSQLVITDPTIVHLVPDLGKTTYQLLQKSGLKLNNCRAVITKSRQLKLGAVTFNARKLYMDTKSNLMTNSGSSPSINVLQTIPDKLSKGYFIAIDHTITSQATEYITGLTNANRSLFFMFQQLKKEFKYVKAKFPKYKNVILFMIDGTNPGEYSIYDLLKRAGVTSQEDLNTNFKAFDNFALTSVITDDSADIFPVIGIDTKGNVKAFPSNISRIPKLLSKPVDQIKDLSKFDQIKNSSSNDSLQSNIISQSKIDVKSKVQDDGTVKSEFKINQRQLSRILKKYKVTDKTVGDNIKASLDNYIASVGDSPTTDDAELAVLKAVNLTVFGTSKIADEYQDNPSKLISKLEEVNTYSEKITIPKSKLGHMLEPSEAVSLTRVTGLVRQKYEFSDNIHGNIKKLFKSLENRIDFPIKVVGFKHDYQDNHLNRVINYEITLKNLAGGENEPYTVNIKVPALVNDRYFKLNGKDYIMANQQYLVPVTKTAPDECRLLTPYAITTLSIVNMKFSISEIERILEYADTKYSQIFKKITREKDKIIGAEFKSGAIVNIIESPYYNFNDEQLKMEDGKLQIVKEGEELPLTMGKSEYLFEKIMNEIQLANPDETLKKTSKSIPYIQIYMSSIKLPFILYLWQQIGLINAMSKLGLDFSIASRDAKDGEFQFDLNGGETLFIKINSKKDELLVNGLLTIDRRKYSFDSKNLNDTESIVDYIQYKCGTRATYHLNNNTDNMIDPVTKELLEFQDKPTTVISLFVDEMVDKLINDQPDSLTDLKIYRSRQAEIMFHLMYKNLMMAHTEYKRNLNFGDDKAKLFLVDSYIIDCLLGVHVHSRGSSVLDLIRTHNPVAELKAASKLIKTGPGGIPGKRSFKKELINIHPSYIGNIGACATTEYADVGKTNHMTLTPLISNQYGSYGVKDPSHCKTWDLVSLDEGLVPFINELDASRAFLAYTHRSQASPIINGDEPLVSTGAEHFIPQLASSRFIQRAEEDGTVKSVEPDRYVEIDYKLKGKRFIDITPRVGMTKRASFINIGLNSLEPKDKFKKGEAIAWSNIFNGQTYTSGKNLKIAVMNYLGFSHEDGYVISQDVSEGIQTEVIEEVMTFIPNGTKVLQIIDQIGTMTHPKDVLLEFSYGGDLDEYIDQFNMLDNEEDNEAALFMATGNKIKTLSPGGEIAGIRIYLNNRDNVDPIIVELWKNITNDLKDRQKKYAIGSTKAKDKLKAVDNLDMSQLKIGTHKHRGIEFEGAKVSFFIKSTKILNNGDKLANRYGAKGVITKVIDRDQIPYGEHMGNIDIFISPISVLGRKNIASIKEVYIGKIFYFLPKILKEHLSSSNMTTSSIRNKILSIYETLDASENNTHFKSIKSKLASLTDAKFRKMIQNDELKFNYIIEPFTNIQMSRIRDAAEILGIELDERVFIPELGIWTKEKVPVGIQYMNSLEQLATDYESIRSTGGYVALTGQPKKGKSESSQSIGNLDIYNILTYNCPRLLEELMTIRSDDVKSKRYVVTDIIQNGSAKIPKFTGDASTKNLHKIHMIAMGLDVQ